MNADLNGVGGTQDKGAGILEAPSDVGDGEICVEGSFRTGEAHVDGDDELVVLAEQSEGAFHLDAGITFRWNTAFEVMRRECNLRILLTLDYLAMHF